jgi:hypothetical protein
MDMDRIMGVLTLKAPTYRQIADDPNATTPAGIITAVVALISGFFGGLVSFDTAAGTASVNFMGGIILAIITVVLALIGWFITGWVLAFVSKWFGGKTNTQEMLRVTGFVNIFGLVGVLSILALITPTLGCVTGLVGFVAAILRLIGYVIGVREAAEFSTGNAIITAIVAAIVNFLIVAVIGGTVAAAFGVGAALIGGAQ